MHFSASPGLSTLGPSATTSSFWGFAALIVSKTCLVVSGRLKIVKITGAVVTAIILPILEATLSDVTGLDRIRIRRRSGNTPSTSGMRATLVGHRMDSDHAYPTCDADR